MGVERAERPPNNSLSQTAEAMSEFTEFTIAQRGRRC
jgi:hypothetical protein